MFPRPVTTADRCLSKYDTTIPFLQATAIALVVTLVIVFNAGILAWPLGRLSQGFWAHLIRTARPKMEMTSNVFPVRWGRTLSRIRKSDAEDVLDESRYTYLMFLVVYWLVEFPAYRIVLAYDFVTKNEMRSADHIGLAVIQVLVAIILLPLFVAVWTILVVYSILNWTATSLKAPQKRDVGEQPEKPEQERRNSFADGDDTKTYKGPKNAEGTAEEQTRRDRREKDVRDRKEKRERVRKQVSLLINPPELYESKLKPYNEKIKALTRRKEKRGSRESIKSSSSAPSQPKAPHRSIWPFAKRGAATAANDTEGLQEQEELVRIV